MALNAYIVEAVRTPAGRKNGLLSAYHPCALGGKETCLTIAEPDNFPFISSRSHSISPFSFFSSLYPFSWDVAVVIDAILDRSGRQSCTRVCSLAEPDPTSFSWRILANFKRTDQSLFWNFCWQFSLRRNIAFIQLRPVQQAPNHCSRYYCGQTMRLLSAGSRLYLDCAMFLSASSVRLISL